MRRLHAAALAAITGLLASVIAGVIGAPQPAAAVAAAAHVTTYTYGAPAREAAQNDTAPERGPQVKDYAKNAHDAGDRWSQGSSTRLRHASTGKSYAYDAPVHPAQIDSAGGGANEPAGPHNGGASALEH